MAVKLKLKKGDNVIVVAGRDKGKRGEILEVIRGEAAGDHRVVVAGVNRVKRHTRASPKSPGGIIDKESPIHISNVALADPKDGKASRIGFVFLDDGRKVRFAKKSGEIIDR